MTMIHADNSGLVLPPRVAAVQVIIIPVGITARSTAEEQDKIFESVRDIAARLKKVGIRAQSDVRENYTPDEEFQSLGN